MEVKHDLLRKIPQIDRLLQDNRFMDLSLTWGKTRTTKHTQLVLEEIRQDILSEKIRDEEVLDAENIFRLVKHKQSAEERSYIHPVINCTGISLHTNLGRSPLSPKVMAKLAEISENYSTLEYRLDLGERGSRYDAVEKIITELCGVEAAMVVNNNAAAVMLMLRELARGKEAVVSRGELVEIGGKFRVPEVMEESGAILREVGTTNKTRLSDYAEAITEETACILKVHRSNFLIEGFQEEVTIEELAKLAHERGTILLYDLGSGLLHPEPPAILQNEPTVQEAVEAGCDLISFSGDKLLGGPQAGIILGKRELVELIKKNPLTRALRCDKLTLAALQETLRIYPDVDRINKEIPLFRMLNMSLEELSSRAGKLQDLLNRGGLSSVITKTRGEVGGGSAPGVYFDSIAVSIRADQVDFRLQDMEEATRMGEPPIICYIQHDQLNFDLRTVEDQDLPILAKGILESAEKARELADKRQGKRN